jgi:hypothetical protein
MVCEKTTNVYVFVVVTPHKYHITSTKMLDAQLETHLKPK